MYCESQQVELSLSAPHQSVSRRRAASACTKHRACTWRVPCNGSLEVDLTGCEALRSLVAPLKKKKCDIFNVNVGMKVNVHLY